MNENGQKPVQKQKILFVITQGSWGGAQRYVYDLATNINEDFDVTVAVGEPNGARDLQDKIFKYCNIKILSLHHLVRRISPLHDILAIFELFRLYKKLQPDIVHLNSSKAGITGSIAKSLIFSLQSPIPLVYTVHGWVFDEPMSSLKRAIYVWMEKFTAKFKDKIIVISNKDKETAEKILKIPEKKLQMIKHGIDADQNYFAKNEARVKLREISGVNIPDGTWIGVVANFYRTKGLDILLEAIGAIQNKMNNVRFVLIGDGPEKNELVRLIKKDNLEKIVFLTGFIDNAREFINAFDFIIQPSRKEGFPYTILEAIQAKVPVIATSVGGVPEIIVNKKTGLLVEKAEARYLSDALLFALNNQEIMKSWADAASAKTSSSTKLDDMIQRTVACYSL